MEKNTVNTFLLSNAKFLPSSKISSVKSLLESATDDKVVNIQSIDFKDPSTIFLFSFFFGGLGLDRFMIGQPGFGIIKLLTLGGLGLWALIDLFRIKSITRESNYRKLIDSLK